jgi:uncharacterized Ntn-hydrolase superfamily protein
MTFSIVGRSTDGTALGVAVASKFLAVGAAVPAAESHAGAIATQSYANLAYRPDGLAMLRSGRSAPDTLAALTAADALRAQRQAGIVDRDGRSASFTGEECNSWAGGRTGPDYAVQGNILTGPEVVEAMERAWLTSDPAAPLSRRLLAALTAGDEAGGDRRGRQSAALLVVTPGGGYGGGSDVYADLRVDDSPNPVPELVRLLGLHDVFFGSTDPEELRPLEGRLLDEVNGLLVQVGHPPRGDGAGAVRAALWDWAGVENLEGRVPEAPVIDPVVLQVLRGKAAEGEPGPVKSPDAAS